MMSSICGAQWAINPNSQNTLGDSQENKCGHSYHLPVETKYSDSDFYQSHLENWRTGS